MKVKRFRRSRQSVLLQNFEKNLEMKMKRRWVHIRKQSNKITVTEKITQFNNLIIYFNTIATSSWTSLKSGMLYIDLRPGQTYHSKDGGSCIFRRPVMGRDCIGELGWQYGTRLKSHSTVTNWCTGRRWPVNCMTVISAQWRSNMPFQRRRKLHIPLASYGKRLSGHKTII